MAPRSHAAGNGIAVGAIADEFNILTTVRSPGEKLRSSHLNEAFAALQEKVNEIRNRVLIAAPLQTAIAFAGNFAAIRTVCDELNNIRSAMEGLPRFGQPLPEAKPHWDFLPTIDWFWVRVAGKRRLSRGHFNRSPEVDQSAWSSFDSARWRGFSPFWAGRLCESVAPAIYELFRQLFVPHWCCPLVRHCSFSRRRF